MSIVERVLQAEGVTGCFVLLRLSLTSAGHMALFLFRSALRLPDTGMYVRLPDLATLFTDGEAVLLNRSTGNAGLEGSLHRAENLTRNSALRVINAGDFTESRGTLYLRWAF